MEGPRHQSGGDVSRSMYVCHYIPLTKYIGAYKMATGSQIIQLIMFNFSIQN